MDWERRTQLAAVLKFGIERDGGEEDTEDMEEDMEEENAEGDGAV